ncbi:hypothetical protein QJS66_23330 (plasmid) [Kocuria rhizophila]|nr:hypothetical protein QJS66_23330 [Kocuria rhizophila]
MTYYWRTRHPSCWGHPELSSPSSATRSHPLPPRPALPRCARLDQGHLEEWHAEGHRAGGAK